METFNQDNINYLEAKKKVERLKGFYIHAVVYIVVNLIMIITSSQNSKGEFLNIDNYWTAIFWGIGLFAHGMSVFVPNFIFGKDWEERKIRKLMNKH